jgi:short-subunit dehydrogenase
VKITTVCPSYISTGMFDGASKMFLTPILKPEDVVRDVWREMLKGGPFLITPWSSRLNVALVGAMPVKIRDRFLRAVGVYDSMANFHGHK